MKKTAIVTGGTRGIGLAIAKQLARDGYNLSIFATQAEETCKEALQKIQECGAAYCYTSGSLNCQADREKLVENTLAAFGSIEVLVNNAGIGPRQRADILDMKEESYDEVMGVNTKGTLFLSQIVARQMLSQPIIGEKRGDIINISSCSAVVSSTSRSEYCISKAGISMITTLFADRLAEARILVNEVRPGVIETDMTAIAKEKYDDLIAKGAFPIPRWGKPDDIAKAVSALVGDSFLYSTGIYIDVDGGFHIRRL